MQRTRHGEWSSIRKRAREEQSKAHDRITICSLAGMSEIQRESELEERREKLQKYSDRMMLKQMVADQDGGASSEEEKPSKPTTRRKPVTKREKQLEELKKKRQNKSNKQKRRQNGSDYDSEEERRANREPSVPVYSDSDEDAENDSDAPRVTKKSKGKSREAATHEQFNKITIPRGRLATFWPCPWFGEYVEGAFVKVGVGRENDETIYRLAKIEKVSDKRSSRPYKLEKHMTDIKLTLAIGNDKRDMTMEMFSNSAASEVSSGRSSLSGFCQSANDNKPSPHSESSIDMWPF